VSPARPRTVEAPRAVLESCLYATDLDEAERFYGNVVGLARHSRAGDRHVFFRLARQMVLIFNPKETEKPPGPDQLPVPPHGARGPGHLCFTVPAAALEAWAAHLAAAGFPVEAEITWPNGARSIYVRDPAGNSVEFAEPGLWFGD
jgi:catechol 2,3-dioxygenase-like lactoylglutathione lyase family enzyme